MKIILILLPIVSLAGVLVFRKRAWVRWFAVALIVLSMQTVVGLMAPHRVAAELVLKSPQGPEWSRGARDTRDAVYSVLPILASSFFALVVLALVPHRKQ